MTSEYHKERGVTNRRDEKCDCLACRIVIEKNLGCEHQRYYDKRGVVYEGDSCPVCLAIAKVEEILDTKVMKHLEDESEQKHVVLTCCREELKKQIRDLK